MNRLRRPGRRRVCRRSARSVYRGVIYRLIVSDLPYVENIFPAAVQAGAMAALTVFGRNLGPQSQPSVRRRRAPLSTLFSTCVRRHLDRRAYTFQFHPTHHSVLPTAATCTLAGFPTAPAELQNAWNPQPLPRHSRCRQQQPNDTREQAQVTLPAVVRGFEQPRDADWFRFQAPPRAVRINWKCSERIAGRADPYLVLTDENGSHPGAGRFRHPYERLRRHAILRGRQPHKGQDLPRWCRSLPKAKLPDVLTIARQEPDFYPAVIHSSNPNPGETTLWKGSAAYLMIVHAKVTTGRSPRPRTCRRECIASRCISTTTPAAYSCCGPTRMPPSGPGWCD